MKRKKSEALFKLGQVEVTPGALDALKEAGQGTWEFLNRHRAGDWGELDDHDRRQNEYNLMHGLKLSSVYTLRTSVRLRIVTEAADEDGYRSGTTISVGG